MLHGSRRDLRRLQALAKGLAPPGHALVGLHLDQRRAAAGDPALRESERLGERRAQHVRPHLRDLHAMPTCGRRGRTSFGRLSTISMSCLRSFTSSKRFSISCGSFFRSYSSPAPERRSTVSLWVFVRTVRRSRSTPEREARRSHSL